MQVTVIGKASKSNKQIPVKEEELSMTLLAFLFSKEIPIASSCRGVGSCGMCYFNENKLSCQVTVKEMLNSKIEVDYL